MRCRRRRHELVEVASLGVDDTGAVVVEVLPLIGASHIVAIRRHAVADDAGADLAKLRILNHARVNQRLNLSITLYHSLAKYRLSSAINS